MSLESVTPTTERGKIYFCDILFERQAINGRSFYRGTLYRAEA